MNLKELGSKYPIHDANITKVFYDTENRILQIT
jgi:hypothetical protein